MIVDLPDTTTAKVSRHLIKIREEGGAVALGRVLTLVISTAPGEEEDAIAAANEASREHPMRVIVLSIPPETANISHRLDAEIRVGGDAGASEVIVLRAYGEVGSDQRGLITGLLLPDTPIVVWWPGTMPHDVSATDIGRMAQCRITDVSSMPEPEAALRERSETYAPGDADFAWTRVTQWRTQLAAALDQPPYEPVTAARIRMAGDSPSGLLLAAWLRLALGVPVELVITSSQEPDGSIREVVLTRPSGDISLKRHGKNVGRLEQPGQPHHDVALPRRSLRDCLAEELRRLDPDVVYGEVVTQGLAQLSEVS